MILTKALLSQTKFRLEVTGLVLMKILEINKRMELIPNTSAQKELMGEPKTRP